MGPVTKVTVDRHRPPFDNARIATEAAVVEDDLAALDVIAKTEAPPTEAVLATFSGRHPFEFQDIVLAAPVIRVGVENGERSRIDTGKFWMLLREAT